MEMDVEKKEKGIVSRILKIVGIVLASFVVVVAGAIGIAILSGQFEKEVIQITHIYFDGDTKNTTKTIRTLDDVVTNINFAPYNATEKELTITVDGNEDGIIESLPSKITAGKDFTIKVNKDSNGNNIGGVVTISALTSNGFTKVTLRVVVDTQIPDNSLYFSGTVSNKVTTQGKTFTIPIKEKEQYIYLKSGLVNAFNFVGGDKSYKSVDVSYVYNSSEGVSEGTIPFNQRLVDKVDNNYYYKIPIVADKSGTITITARMHKTSEIEEEFEEYKFYELEALLQNLANAPTGSTRKDELSLEASARLDKYRDFLNKYIEYFDTPENDASYKFFKSYLYDSTRLSEDVELFKESLDFVYVTCTATIEVTAIEITEFTTIKTLSPYTVFDSVKYSYSATGNNVLSLKDKFNIEIKDNRDGGAKIDDEQIEQYVKQNIVLKPYLYLDASYVSDDDFTFLGDKEAIKWSGRTYTYMPVFGFDDGTPVVTRTSNNYDIVGYLLALTEQDEFISISESGNDEKVWEVTCNTPLPNSSSDEITKALYICLEVSGYSSTPQTQTLKTFQSFTRVSINYNDYKFNGSANRISLDSLSDMTINTNLTNVGIQKQRTQTISLNYDEISSTSTPSYTSVMYFVESSSNKLANDVSKIATRGKYNFITFDNANNNISTTLKLDGDDLVGERIPTYNLKGKQKEYYIQALNSSQEDVKIFAVVYLSDKSGNPVDVNGRKLVINEDSDTIPQLVVVQYTTIDESMPSITINSYLDEVNFYTESKIDYTVSDDIKLDEGFLKRNVLSSYTKEDGNLASITELEKMTKFLKLKLLKNNNFTLYVTPFTLNLNGDVEENDRDESVDLYDINGKKMRLTYTIDTRSNKQIAFNTICGNANIFNTYKLETGSGVSIQSTEKCTDGDNFTMIKYVICATGDSSDSKTSSSNWMIYYHATTDCQYPYSTTLTPTSDSGNNAKNNWVNYEINQLEVYDVQIDYSQNPSYTKLYATYSSSGNNGEQVFQYHSATTGDKGYQSSAYTLKIENDNIMYTVATNIYIEDEEGLEVINLDIVDCAQAVSGADGDNGEVTGNNYENIDQYIASLITGNSAEVIYSSPTTMVSILDTVSFNNALPSDEDDNANTYGNYIYFGASKFAFDRTSDYVDINGYQVPLVKGSEEDEYKIVINKGEYFPKIGKDVVLIYNEEFEIVSDAMESKRQYIQARPSEDGGTPIYIEEGANVLLSSGSTIAYGSSTYIDSNGGAGQNSAITLGGDNATVNFVQGEEVGYAVEDEQGLYKQVVSGNYQLIEKDEDTSGITRYSIKPIYVEDNYGDFYLDTDGTYKVLNASQLSTYTGTRYSKKGVTVYLLVTFNVMKTSSGSSEYTFNRTISYELIQENIEVIGYNSANSINSQQNPYEVAGGQTIEIPLGNSGNSNAFIRTTAGKETYFFNHVSFSIVSGKDDVTCEKNESSSSIKLTLPNLTSDISVVVKMEYMYKGQKQTIDGFYIIIKANVNFTWKGDKSSQNSITLDSTEYGYSLKDVLENYYNIDDKIEDITLTLKDSTQQGVRVENNASYTSKKINVDTYYAEYDGSSLSERKVVFTVTLTVNGKQVSAEDITFVVKPTYVADLSELNDITIYNGDNLYAEYIKLFNGNVSGGEIKNATPLSSSDARYGIFTITTDNENVEISNGVIKLKSAPYVDTKVKLTLQCKDNIISAKTFEITIRGISMIYSPSGAISNGSSTDKQILNNATENKDLTITVDSMENFDINKYLYVSLITTGGDEITVVLINEDGTEVIDYESGKTYYVAYARLTGGSGHNVVEKTGFTVKITTSNK